MAVPALGEIHRSAPLARIALFARSFIETYEVRDLEQQCKRRIDDPKDCICLSSRQGNSSSKMRKELHTSSPNQGEKNDGLNHLSLSTYSTITTT
jgi:hypothetical protein